MKEKYIKNWNIVASNKEIASTSKIIEIEIIYSWQYFSWGFPQLVPTIS